MGREIDLLKRYPKSNRDLSKRLQSKSDESREIARRFDKEFFDGSRENGYGGFTYNPKYWTDVVQDLIFEYGLTKNSSVLDIGCAKGYFLHDLKLAIPGITLCGIDISEYAINNSIETVRQDVRIANAKELPFKDDSFDLVISINTVHNLDITECAKAIKEIERVSKGYAFITVDAYRTELERERMEAWNLTAKTIMSCDEWKIFFKEIGYTGDYYWFIP